MYILLIALSVELFTMPFMATPSLHMMSFLLRLDASSPLQTEENVLKQQATRHYYTLVPYFTHICDHGNVGKHWALANQTRLHPLDIVIHSCAASMLVSVS